MNIYVDADACPVKSEVCRVARRHGAAVTFVSNIAMRFPEPDISCLVVVSGGFDAADDWIECRARSGDVVVTTDVPLADRCIRKGAAVVTPDGRILSEENIGAIVATRNLLSELRGMGNPLGGPPPFGKRERSGFLQSLELVVRGIKKKGNADCADAAGGTDGADA
jgi:uncharacterized protein YaiI (UPF0178 family)